MPDLECVRCGVRYRGCPHCLTLVDVHEIFCSKCGRPLPGCLPDEDESAQSAQDQTVFSSDRLTRLEIGPTSTETASEDAGTMTPQASPNTVVDAKGRVAMPSRLVSEKGVVEDQNDPMEILTKHDSYSAYKLDPFTVSPLVGPSYRRYLFFAHIFRLVFALVLLAMFYFFLWPSLRPISEFVVVGVGMGWYSDGLFLVAGGLVLVILVYTISYYIIYRPFGRRTPRDGS